LGTTEIAFSPDGRGKPWKIPPDEETSPHLRVLAIERTAIIRFLDAEIYFEETALRAISRQLHRLLLEEGHTRLVVNFAGVQHLPCALLGVLASLQKQIEPARGRIHLCGLAPLLRDMLRITRLDRVFNVYGDEVEALGLIAR
jgi:anti-sigma B factor antagonist